LNRKENKYKKEKVIKMASRELSDLLGPVKAKSIAFLHACNSVGLDVIITCTYRPDMEQSALYAQGRAPLAIVNQLRKTAGLFPISEQENEHKVTNSRPGTSLHAQRRAIDVVPIVGGKPVVNAEHPVWRMLGKIGKSCGLEWGGDWSLYREMAHFQDMEPATARQTLDD
jgi:peptidoglycan L-alanyl-D-glutamate endopeptidase CwlK